MSVSCHQGSNLYREFAIHYNNPSSFCEFVVQDQEPITLTSSQLSCDNGVRVCGCDNVLNFIRQVSRVPYIR